MYSTFYVSPFFLLPTILFSESVEVGQQPRRQQHQQLPCHEQPRQQRLRQEQLLRVLVQPCQQLSLDKTEKPYVNVNIRLLLSLSCWLKMILLCGGHSSKITIPVIEI